jgi:hypothetical protein
VVGLYLADGKSEGLSIVVAPWNVPGSGAATSASCTTCERPICPAIFRHKDLQSWGLSLTVTAAWPHDR